jgi:hypothetical protein
MLRFRLQFANPVLPEQKYAQVKSASVAEAACDLELLDCGSFGCRSADHFTVAGASFARRSRVAFSLRRHIECVVRWCLAGTARDGALRCRFLLLLLATDAVVGCKA